MKKQYMDFRPVRPAKKVVKKEVKQGSVAPRVVVQPKKVQASKPLASKAKVRTQKTPKLGEIEDLTPRYTEADLKKRPLGERRQPEIAKIKAQKVGNKATESHSKNENVKKAASEEKKVYKAPKSPFINQEKVVKRPLSKNVYQKKVEVPKEEPKGPVTIINKPKKDEKVGLIIAVILTIILGAAAGTVAFLLIPK